LGARVNGVYEPFGLPFLYSWPSLATFAATDKDSARLSLDYLKKLLQLVVDKSDAKNLDLIAHSMGNQPLLHVLEPLAKDNPKVVFNQIILAAPDVYRDEFEKIAASIGTVAKGITLYAASNDRAM
jgi:esterase/lipase superfamily enzyme